jgi:hypothetical protein
LHLFRERLALRAEIAFNRLTMPAKITRERLAILVDLHFGQATLTSRSCTRRILDCSEWPFP